MILIVSIFYTPGFLFWKTTLETVPYILAYIMLITCKVQSGRFQIEHLSIEPCIKTDE